MAAKRRRVGFLLYESCDLLDLSGPAAVFHSAHWHLTSLGELAQPTPELSYFSPDGGLIVTGQGLPVGTRPMHEIAAARLDTLIVVGSFYVHESCDERLVTCVREMHGSVRRLASVCTGAFVLALAGLLDGRRAVTHWRDCAEFQRRFPAVDVDPDCIFIEDEGIWTSAGVSAGIDMALAMLEQDYGHELAWAVAARLVVFLKRPGGQTQLSMELRGQGISGPIAQLLKWIAANPHRDLRAEVLADRVNMSLRNFYRAFEEATGTSPAEWVEATRLEIAKRLLEHTAENADQVALKAGFVNYERMRRAFSKRLGASPLAYRNRAAKPSDAPAGDIYLRSVSLISP
ncbi:MAG: helix-turn-helix domain-containing protein [Novosphingobium sp.]|nr:helix-turn-helix domain-containing protein [Novosphingobium sp.]